MVFLRNRPDLAARLADFALREGIETDYVRMLITRNALAAPPGASEAWPFRLRIRALGGFELDRDGQPMRFAGKAQQRPLDLLKFVVALGGEDVESSAVTSALWPDADGAAAKTSFDTALFRLRKLLDVDDALGSPAASCRSPPTSSGPTCAPSTRRSTPRTPPPRRRGRASHRGCAGAARRLSRSAARHRGRAVDRQAARRAARALLRLLLALGEALERRATGRPRSTSIVAASRPTTSPSRSTAA